MSERGWKMVMKTPMKTHENFDKHYKWKVKPSKVYFPFNEITQFSA